MKFRVALVIVPLVFCITAVRNEPAPITDFIEVHPGAKMHYCLHYAKIEVFQVMPLIIWLSDGLRRDSCNCGVEQISSWINYTNLLFVNSPVGIIQTPSEIINEGGILPNSEADIAGDLSVFIQEFYKRHKDFQAVPLHIYGETYGARMALALAIEIWDLTKFQLIPNNIVSVNLITPWIEPVVSIFEWAPMLFNLSLIDESFYGEIINLSTKIKELVGKSQLQDAYRLLAHLLQRIHKMVGNIHFDDIRNFDIQHEGRDHFAVENLVKLMNLSYHHPTNDTEMNSRQQLMAQLSEDYLKSYTKEVQYILDETFIEITVICDNFNLMTPINGLIYWINNMNWKNKTIYMNAERDLVFSNRNVKVYKNDGNNFKLFWLYENYQSSAKHRESALLFIMQNMTFNTLGVYGPDTGA